MTHPDQVADRDPSTAPTAAIAELPARVLAAQLPLDAGWDRVMTKAGMPGVDGVPVSRFRRLGSPAVRTLEQELASESYRPLPLRMAEMEKKNGERRLLLVPAVRDRVVQTALAMWLGAKWNTGFDSASFAYRPGFGVHAALRYLRELHESGFRWVFDADIRSCFDSIAHDQLFGWLADWLGPASPVLEWLTTSVAAFVWDGADLSRLTRGIPQGSPMSPLLANFFLDRFDRRMRQAGVKFIRYADDFLVLTRTPFDMGPAREVVEQALRDLGLELNPEKTQTTTFDRRFRFLGAEIQGDAILLPFEKRKTAFRPLFVAPVMPPALLRAWRLGHLATDRSFVWTSRREQPVSAAPVKIDRHEALLQQLAGRRVRRNDRSSSK